MGHATSCAYQWGGKKCLAKLNALANLINSTNFPNITMLEMGAHAKINLSLDVVKRLQNSYHEIRSVKQQISLCDKITIEEAPETKIESNADIPLNENNIVFKAVNLIKNKFNINKNVRIKIQKNIPIAAGLAGGSTDAAATLKLLNQLWNLNQTQDQLLELAKQLGMDVPFCLIGKTALATGRGEFVKSLPPSPKMYLVLVNPGIKISTMEAYANLDEKDMGKSNSTTLMQDAINNQDITKIAKALHNDFEKTILAKHLEIQNIKTKMKNLGALNALMSGSGSTVFCITETKQEAEQIYNQLKQEYKNTFLCETI